MREENKKKEIKEKKKAKAKEAKNGKSLGAPELLNNLRYGKTVSVNFFKTNAWLLITFIAVVLALMGMRYKTKTKMEEIQKLEKELTRCESEKLREKAAYMTLIRETEMARLVTENNLGLIFQEQPPYTVILRTEE